VQPPGSLSPLSDPLYESFYGLREQPFAISTDPKFLFLSAGHRRAYEELMNGISRDESLLLLTGETGSGKTTLARAVIAATGDRTFSSVLHQPYMTGPEMLRLILRDFGLVSKEELRRGSLAHADVPHLMEVMETFLASLIAVQARAVVVIDEAQSLSPTLLDEVRMLTAFERDGKRLVQIILCGQPMLLNTLKTEAMYALNERITRRVVLTPLSSGEVEQYIYHRLSIAGGAEKLAFEPDAMRLIADLSRGLPRRVNVLADRTLQEGRLDGVTRITGTLVKRAAKALAGAHAAAQQTGILGDPGAQEPGAADPADAMDFTNADALSLTLGGERKNERPKQLIAIAVAALFVLGLGGYFFYGNQLVTSGLDYTVPRQTARPGTGPAPVPPIPTQDELDAYFRELGLLIVTGRYPGGGI
jgi:type II secretory pathway predicted ATPase ExeA